MILTFTLIFFSFGLIIGSFLNVVIYRINTVRSLGGRSACMSCGTKLSWCELVPLFSFLALSGRCKNCKTKISIQYPLIELATGLVFGILFFKFYNFLFISAVISAVNYAYYTLVFSLLIVIATYDLKHKIIPDTLALFFGLLAFIGLFFFSGDSFHPHFPVPLDLLSGIIVALPFALLWLISDGAWMGLGDAKLVLGIGWLLGLTQAFSAIVIAFWFGAIIGIMLVLTSAKYKIKSEIPFAPYLVFGTFLAFIFHINIFWL